MGFYRSDREVQDAGDFSVIAFFGMAEDDHPLVLFGQGVNGLLDQPGALALNDRFIGLIGRIGKFEAVVALLEPDRFVDREGFKLLLPDVIDGAVGGNLVKPGRECIRFVKIFSDANALTKVSWVRSSTCSLM